MLLREATIEDMQATAAKGIEDGACGCMATIPPYALVDQGEVLAVVGMVLVSPTTAWCYMNVSKEVHGRVIAAYRVLGEWFNQVVKTHRLERLMAVVRADFPEGIRTVEHMGFRREAELPRFYGDKPGLLYVRFEELQT